MAHLKFNEQLCSGLQSIAASFPEVELAYVFGSRVTGNYRDDSDLDVAVLLNRMVFRHEKARFRWLKSFLAACGQVLPPEFLDLVLLNQAPVVLKYRVLRDGRLIYAKSSSSKVNFFIRTLQEYRDSAYYRELFCRYRIRRLREGKRPGGRARDIVAQARRLGRVLREAQGFQKGD